MCFLASYFGKRRSDFELSQPSHLVKIRYFGHHRSMEQSTAIEAFAALAQPTRIAAFRLLVRVGPKGLPALEISRQLGTKPSTLSGHLAILKRAGVLVATRHQREIHYAANLATVNALVQFLIADCCGGKIENCTEIVALLDWQPSP
jgi:ArsR family transcriptional regulator